MDYLIITCNPDNYASGRTCEYVGCHFIETVELPKDNNMRIEDGETEKCIFRIDLRERAGLADLIINYAARNLP